MANPAISDFNTFNSIAGGDYMSKSYINEIIRLSPNGSSPLFNILSTTTAEKMSKSKFHGYFTKTMLFPAVTLTAAVADGVATTFTVASTAGILPGDLLQASGGAKEQVRVTAVNSGTSLTVTRGFGTITPVAISNSTVLYQVGNVFEDASARPQPRAMMPTNVLNFTQIFRNTWGVSRSSAAFDPIAGNSIIAESQEDMKLFHAASIEQQLLFGQRFQGTANGQMITAMDGVVESVRRMAPIANTNTAGGTTNFAQLEGFLNPTVDTQVRGREGSMRTLFVGGKAKTVINNIGKTTGQYQMTQGQTQFGMQFAEFYTSRAQFRVIEHPMLNANPAWTSMAIAVDTSQLSLAYVPNAKQQEISYNQRGEFTTGEDSVGGDILSELTLENLNPTAHAVIYGLTAAA